MIKRLKKICIDYTKFVALNTLQKLLSSNKSSFYTISYNRFAAQHALWNKYLPDVKPYYAVKCNPDPTLLQWFSNNSVSFDCASTREMVLVKNHFKKQSFGDKILFANPCKTNSDIVYAKKHKIPCVTVDSAEEVIKMKELNYTPDILLRIAIDDTSSRCQFGAKFGLHLNEVHSVVEKINSIKKSCSITGISFHIGSGSKDPTIYRTAVELSKELWTTLQKDELVGTFKVLDLGGGWSSEEELFKQQAFHANEGLLFENYPEKIIAEPGRFFAAPVYDLYVRVVGKKPKPNGGWRYTIDESIYGQFSCIPFDHATPNIYRISVNSNDRQRFKMPATVFGRTCDSLDWIANSHSMEELHVGDWLYIPAMGAYTMSTSTEFNGFPKPECIKMECQPDSKTLYKIDNLQFPLSSMLSVPQ